MNLKGDFNPGTTYSIGDVVRFNEMAFVLKEEAPAGTLPIDTLRWNRLDQYMWDVVDMILDTAALNVSDEGIILKGTTDPDNKYYISVDDSGLAPEIAVDLIEEES